MPQASTAPRVLTQKIRIKASPERLFKALTDAQELMKWFPDRAATEPRVGGALRYEFEAGTVCNGTYLEIVPNQLVSYSWCQPLECGAQGDRLSNLTVTFRLEPHGEYTDVVLEETGYIDDPEHTELHGKRTGGWSFFFDNLQAYLERGEDNR